MAKKNRNPEDIVFSDRRLTGERDEDNPYITCALYFLVGLMSLMLIMVVFVAMCLVDGNSMNDSYQNGDNILIYRFASDFRHDDVIVFDIKRDEKDDRLIKRVIGVGGDELLFVRNRDGNAETETMTLYRKSAGTDTFVKLDEDYIKEPMLISHIGTKYKVAENPSEVGKAIPIEDGFLFVLGDNRNDSSDSRSFGVIPEKSVVGKEIFHFTQGSLLEKIMMLIFGKPKAA